MKGRARLDLIVAVAILLVLVVANATIYAPKRKQLDTLADELVRAEKELLYVAGHSEALAQVADFLPQPAADSGDHRFLSGVTSELDHLGSHSQGSSRRERRPIRVRTCVATTRCRSRAATTA